MLKPEVALNHGEGTPVHHPSSPLKWSEQQPWDTISHCSYIWQRFVSSVLQSVHQLTEENGKC